MKIALFTVNYFSESDTLEFVAGLKDIFIPGDLDVSVHVFDNGSKNAAEFSAQLGDLGAEYSSLGDNVGLAPAWNALYKAHSCKLSDNDFLIFCNNDIKISTDFFTHFKSIAELTAKDEYLFGPVIYKDNAVGSVWSSGGDFRFYGVSVRHSNRVVDSTKAYPVGHVSACFLITTKKVFEKVGGWGGEFFFRGEEWDINLRAKKMGVKRAIFPFLKITHKINGSHSQYSGKYFYFTVAAKIIYWKKHFRSIQLMLRAFFLVKLLIDLLFVFRVRGIPVNFLHFKALLQIFTRPL
ncbi:glycosyltransferase family 2 protein [Teredinibacter turnerae]|uniref:glycosyltransferase family 2 protein n=1 Tax=Teredinibacter turnerae TaxID=2426 RepID=UPI000414B988|nr:glycosyltransferase family 2 protein [Teredinibacter turnerae]